MTRLLVCGAMLLALSACEGDGLGPVTGNLGALRYSRSGGTTIPSGTYEALGRLELTPSGGLKLGEWAYAQPPAVESRSLFITAARRGADGLYEIAYLNLPPDVRAGDRFSFVAGCGSFWPVTCGRLNMDFGVDALDIVPRLECRWTEGEIHVTGRSAHRINGTFQGTLACENRSAGSGETLRVSDGAFDVPFVDIPVF